MVKDLQTLKDLATNKQISFIRIKEDNSLLKCEAFSALGYIGDYVLKNKVVIEKVKDRAIVNKVKGTDLEAIIRDVARLHLKLKSGWVENY